MANFRGMDGYLSLGGILVATVGPLVNGALIAGATTLSLDGTGLTGIVAKGDKFTIAGEAGSPVHTVTGGPFYVAAANAIVGLTFSTPIAGGGAADNAVITFVSNSVAEMKVETINSTIEVLDDTVQGDVWGTCVGGCAKWTGSGEAWLDYGDPKQKLLIDLAGAATAQIDAVLFGIASKKQWYASALLSGFSVTSDKGALVGVTFNFSGNGAILPNWN
jgi:hypothetical protein